MKETRASNGSGSPAPSEFYCSMAMHVVLLLLTCGIWMYIWIYRMTRCTNVPGQEERNPTNKLLLCLFVPFYIIYWTYKTAQRVDLMARQSGIASDITTLCLILEFFIPIVPPILMQDKMNAIANAQTNPMNGFNNMNSAGSDMANSTVSSGNQSGMPYGAVQYQPVFQMPGSLYAEGAPIILENGALLKHPQNGQVFAQLRFRSISPARIIALKVLIHCLDSADRGLGEAISHAYLDLDVGRDQVFGENLQIHLPDPSTRSFAVEVAEVVFADKHLWTADGREYLTLPSPNPLENSLRDSRLQQQYKMEICPRAQYAYFEASDLWHCACGAFNRVDEPCCHTCGTERRKMKTIDLSILKTHADERFEQEMAQRAARKAQEETEQAVKKARNIKIAKIAVPVAVVLIAVLIVTQTVIPNVRYNSAVSLMEEGNYTEALAAFEKLGDLKDSEDKLTECKEVLYTKAEDLFAQGSYDEAREIYNSIHGESESDDMARACDQMPLFEADYQNALILMDQGDYAAAREAFSALSSTISDFMSSILGSDDVITRRLNILFESEDYEDALTELILNADFRKSIRHLLMPATNFPQIPRAQNAVP